MTAPTFAIDRTVLDELRRGDEPALQRLFRSAYPSLLAEAKTQLGDQAASANRVVERAFVRLWEERATITTPEALEAFIHGAVHDIAVRERSRLGALHRFEANERVRGGTHHAAAAEPTADEAWTHLQQSLHAGTGSREVREHARAQQSHEAAAHMASIGKKRSWLVPVAGLVLTAVAVTVAISLLARGSTDAVLTNALVGTEVRQVAAGSAQIGMVALDDANRVKLAPESKLGIPPKFGPAVHGFRLDGTAEVTAGRGQTVPLEVRAGRAGIVIPSGVVDIATDSVHKTLIMRVREGSATVKMIGQKEIHPVAAGAVVAMDSTGAMSTPSAAAVTDAIGWTDGTVTITNRSLRETLATVKRWWGLELYAKDTALLKRPVTMSASLDSPKGVIAAIEKGGQLKFGWEGKNMVLADAAKK